MCKATARVASSGAQKAVCHLFIFLNIVFVPFQCICNVLYFVPVNFLFICSRRCPEPVSVSYSTISLKKGGCYGIL